MAKKVEEKEVKGKKGEYDEEGWKIVKVGKKVQLSQHKTGKFLTEDKVSFAPKGEYKKNQEDEALEEFAIFDKGELPADKITGYCVKCKKKGVQMKNPKKVVKGAHKMYKGTCPTCGTGICRIF